MNQTGDPDQVTVTDVVSAVLGQVSRLPVVNCRSGLLDLQHDLGIDSLGVAEMVGMLQVRLGIVVPDEVTARLRTVNDVQQAVHQLITHDESRGHR